MSDRPTVRVRGEAVVEVEPEVARVTVHVESQEADRGKALDRLSERNRRCLELVRSYGEAVEELETGGLSIMPVLKGGRREGDVRGYRGSVQIRMTVADFGVLGELVARLGDLERTYVDGPEWGLRRDSEVYGRVARQAAREAVERARGYAEALGSRLTGLVELSDEGLGGQEPPVAFAAAYDAAGEPEPIDLEPAAQVVRAAVEARFTVSPPDLEAR